MMRIYLVFFIFLFNITETQSQNISEDQRIFNLGWRSFQNGNFDRAAEIFTHGIENDLQPAENFLYGRAYSYYHLGKFEKAASDVRESLRIKKDANSYWLIARIYTRQSEERKAIRMYNRAIRLSPEEPYLYSERGLLWIKRKRMRRAIKDLDHALELNPRLCHGYSNRAYFYLKTGDLEKAKTDLERSFSLNRSNPQAYKNLGLYHIKHRQWDKACRALIRADQLGYSRNMDDTVTELRKRYCDVEIINL